MLDVLSCLFWIPKTNNMAVLRENHMFTYKINDDIHLSLPNPEVDAAPLFRLIDESRNELVPWLPWGLKVKSIEDERKSLVRNLQNLGASNSVNFVICYKNLIAGSVSLKIREPNNKKLNLAIG